MTTSSSYQSSSAQQADVTARNIRRAVEQGNQRSMVKWALSGLTWLTEFSRISQYELPHESVYEQQVAALSEKVAHWFAFDGPGEPFGALLTTYIEMVATDLEKAAEKMEKEDSRYGLHTG